MIDCNTLSTIRRPASLCARCLLRAGILVLAGAIILVPHERVSQSSETTTTGDASPQQYRLLMTPGGIQFGLRQGANKAPAPVAFLFGSLLDEVLTMEHCRILLKAGYVCVALDAPGHGLDRDTSEPTELRSWRHRLVAGRDFVSAFNSRLSSILDYLIAERIADPTLVIAVGGSRGGFLAFHFAGSDPRVRGVAGLAPVTDLRALDEFHGMDDHKLTASLSPIRHAARLAGRSVLVTIGDRDHRVGTDHAIAFARQISKAAQGARVDLHVLAEPRGHRHPEATDELLRTWAAKCLRERSKR
ncbi:MAG: prolyl oligopeptidase family serine peptidase [Pirellulales bacterium]|nr:prolyl oligopeptidase family serine peptidase [Pirellulales bacterium]